MSNKLSELVDKYKLSEKIINDIYRNEILPYNLLNKKSADYPRAVLLGGQPGSGKSKLANIAVAETKSSEGVVIIAADNYRNLHPKFEDEIVKLYPQEAPLIVAPVANKWAAMLIKDAVEERKNIIFESALANSYVATSMIDSFKRAEYKVDLKIMAVKKELSKLGTFLRYESMIKENGWGRAVPPKEHDVRYNNLPGTIYEICKDNKYHNITLYNNLLYFKIDDWKFYPQPISHNSKSPVNDLLRERERFLTFNENMLLATKLQMIEKNMMARGEDISILDREFGYLRGADKGLDI
jgi:AAA+ ATPase superfamily predicted ATPase